MKSANEVAKAIIQRIHDHALEKGKPVPNCFKVSTNNIGMLYETGRYADAAQLLELCRAVRCLGYVAFQTSNNVMCFMKDDVPNHWTRVGFGTKESD